MKVRGYFLWQPAVRASCATHSGERDEIFPGRYATAGSSVWPVWQLGRTRWLPARVTSTGLGQQRLGTYWRLVSRSTSAGAE
jgi:hypothetical protein